MSEWMWFVVAIFGMILAAACVVKWIEAKIKIEKIIAEEWRNYDYQNDTDYS